MKSGCVYLIGAGPGDPELISLRAVRRLQQCDLVLYDALVHTEVLSHCRSDAVCLFVGKRAGEPGGQRQASINRQMIEAANSGQTVGRLKGGDPFLFGRGSEEAEVLHAAGIRFEVIPGVPSSLAAAAYAGISLTHRHLASSVAYLTATESSEKNGQPHDWAKLATATPSLVIFMGRRHLAPLMDRLMEHGRSPDEPAAVVQSASLPTQRTVVGTVADIAAKAAAARIDTPALTFVGPAVTLRSRLRWYDRQPLFGKRVLVTRPVAQAADLVTRLRDAGAAAVVVPMLRIAPPADPTPLAQAVAQLQRYHWLLLTSANGVAALFAEMARQQRDARYLGNLRIVAIGPQTAAALQKHGLRADRVPAEYRGEAVVEAVLQHPDFRLDAARMLLPRSALARDVIPQQLRAAGAEVEVVEAYRSLPPSVDDAQRARQLLHDGALDIVSFTSSSTVQHLVEALQPTGAELLSKMVTASIGPITSATAASLGLRIDLTATDYTAAGLVEALSHYYSSGHG